jgi:tRNA-dependent cyclodipeptide synthase
MNESIENNTRILPTGELPYTPKVRAIFVRAGELKEQFANAKGVILVSVGEPEYEGEKLLALVALVNKHFNSADLVIADSLQRHSLMIQDNLSMDDAHERAKALGAAWIHRNRRVLEQLKKPCEISRWDVWLQKLENVTHRKELYHLYANDIDYKKAMDNSINGYLTRSTRYTNCMTHEQAFMHCVDYLIEECAIMMRLWIQEGYQFILSANDPLEVLTVNHDRFVKPIDPALLRWIRVQLKTLHPKATIPML